MRGQSEATLQTPKGLTSAEAKKLLYQIFLTPLMTHNIFTSMIGLVTWPPLANHTCENML